MKSIKILLLICTMTAAVGAFAVQYSGSSTQGSTPATQSPQMQSPSQTAPGSTQPGQPQGAQQGQPGQSQQQAGRPSVDDQVKMLTQELNLTPEQQTKMKNVLDNQHQQAMTIINDSSLAREDKIQKIRSLRETTITQARSMLNDDQKKKLDTMLQESDKMHQQQGTTGASPSSSGPGSSGATSPSSTSPSSTPPSGSGRPPR